MNLHRQLRIRRMLRRRYGDLAVVLEDIEDPHNAEAVFRSCDAFGVQYVHVVLTRASRRAAAQMSLASSASARKWLSIVCHDHAEPCLRQLKADGFKTVATVAPEPESVSLRQSDLYSGPVALVFGNEKNGLRPETRAMTDLKVSVPMAGLVQSLNLSVTAALCLYEAVEQRRCRGIFRSLPLDEQQRLFRVWQEA